MGKIASYEYPSTKIGTIVKAVEVLWKTFKGEAKDEMTFATALQHKSNKSGGFLQKMADLRRYGFVDKRGIVITERGKRVIEYLKPEEKNQALSEAVMSINLWKDLHKRLGQKTPSSDDFKIQLVELTGDRDSSIAQSEEIRNLYIDAMKSYNGSTKKIVKNEGLQKDEKEHKEEQEPKKMPESLILLSSGDVNITLPRTSGNINILKRILDEMNPSGKMKDNEENKD